MAARPPADFSLGQWLSNCPVRVEADRSSRQALAPAGESGTPGHLGHARRPDPVALPSDPRRGLSALGQQSRAQRPGRRAALFFINNQCLMIYLSCRRGFLRIPQQLNAGNSYDNP